MANKKITDLIDSGQPIDDNTLFETAEQTAPSTFLSFKASFAKLKIAFKSYFDTIYAPIASGGAGASNTETITAGENLAVGNIVYLKSDGKWWKADYLDVARVSTEVRYVNATILANASGESIIFGIITTTGLTAGGRYCVGANGAIILEGSIPDTEGILIRYIGTAKSTTELEFYPDANYYETTQVAGGSGGGAWGDITGTLSDQTDLQSALNAKLDDSQLIDDDTFASATASNMPSSESVKAYVDANIYTAEQAQDAVGSILVDSSEIDLTYNDATPSITASIVTGSIDETKLDASVNASLSLANTSIQATTKTAFNTVLTDGNFQFVGDAPTAHVHAISDVTSLQTALDEKQSIALTSNTPTPSATLDWSPDIINLVLTADTTITAITNAPISGGTLLLKVTGNYKLYFSLSTLQEEGRQIKNTTNYGSLFYDPAGNYALSWFNASKFNDRNYIFEDFESVSSTVAGKLVIVNNSGYIGDGNNSNVDLKGVIELHTNASASAKPFVGTSVKAYQLFGHIYDSTWYVKTPSSLSDGSQTYQILCGYLSSNNALAQQFGAYFKYDYNGTTVADADDNITPSVTWKIVNSKDTTIANKAYTDSTVAVVASTWYKFRIVFKSTQVLFYINDVLRLTYTGANIPTGGFNYFGAGLTIQKSLGTSDRVLQADYFEQIID